MFAQERQQEILKLVNENGAGIVKDLAVRFSVTEDCIRKDLALLEKKELLQRTYGGAVPIRKNPHNFEVRTRRCTNISAKEKIAKKAIALISDGDTVFFDISTANLEIMKEIIKQNKKVTVVTNMLDLIALAGTSGLPLICTGGRLNQTGDGFTGAAPAEFVSRFKFDVGFFGVVGMDTKTLSAYTYSMEDGDMKAAAIRSCKRAFLVGETEKFRQDGNYKYANLTDFESILLEDVPDQDIINTAKKQKITLL